VDFGSCYNAPAMPPYPNLVPTSELAQETVELARRFGGRVPALVVADQVLQIRSLDAKSAAALVKDLIADDPRLRLTSEGEVELVAPAPVGTLLGRDDFVVVDVETTGARTPHCRIMEIGAYRIKDGAIAAEFHRLVNPEMPIPPFIVALTGITDAMVERAPRFADILHDWLEFIRCAPLVAHNAAFDLRFLNNEIDRLFPGYRLANESICTVRLARRVLPGLSSYRLSSLARYFDVPLDQHHRAAGDALATAQIFLRLLARARRASELFSSVG